jgi:hypothetical protein
MGEKVRRGIGIEQNRDRVVGVDDCVVPRWGRSRVHDPHLARGPSLQTRTASKGGVRRPIVVS